MKLLISLAVIFIFAAVYRFSFQNHPFWIDEFSSSIQAKLISHYGIPDVFRQQDYYFETNNLLTHLLISFSFRIFGEHEWTARLPFMFFGSMVPPLIFIATKQLFNIRSATASTILSATSYIMITWSRQARGYALQQVLLLFLIIFLVKFQKNKKISSAVYALVFSLLGLATHFFFGLFLILTFILLFLNRGKSSSKKIALILISAALCFILFFSFANSNVRILLRSFFTGFLSNNFWYYHALLWREETIVTLFAILGIVSAFANKIKHLTTPLIFLLAHIIFITFLLSPYSSKYLLPIFPILFLFAGYGISQLLLFTPMLKDKNLQLFAVAAISFFIAANGNMFVLKPKQYYSVNHSMRDIPIVDYHRMYEIIRKARNTNTNVAVIDTWMDRARWYLGIDATNLYWYRWLSQAGMINGIRLTTNTVTNAQGIKVVQLSGPSPIELISTQKDLERTIKNHPQGFLIIDDTSMPQEVIQYAKSHFYIELELNHYELDDNPYSIWPITLYSWGFHDKS